MEFAVTKETGINAILQLTFEVQYSLEMIMFFLIYNSLHSA